MVLDGLARPWPSKKPGKFLVSVKNRRGKRLSRCVTLFLWCTKYIHAAVSFCQLHYVRTFCIKPLVEPELTSGFPCLNALQKYDTMFERNAKNGSFYLQSKVHRAKECLEPLYQKPDVLNWDCAGALASVWSSMPNWSICRRGSFSFELFVGRIRLIGCNARIMLTNIQNFGWFSLQRLSHCGCNS
jgi:hypothetical protein